MLTIWRKEIKEQLYTWKGSFWLVLTSLAFSFTSYLLLTNKELSLLDQAELLWILGKVVIGVGLLIVTIDAASILTNELEKQTLESLLLTPLSLQNRILGKMAASLTLWFFILLVSIPYLIVSTAGTHLLLPFFGYLALLGTIGVIGVTAISFGISLLFRSSKNSLTTALALVLLLAIPAFFSTTLTAHSTIQTLTHFNPVSLIFACLDNVLVDYQLTLAANWQYLWPLLVFLLVALIFLGGATMRFKQQGIIQNDEI